MNTRTRIVATLGPATDRPGVLPGMVKAGLDVARINLSHGTPPEHARRIGAVRDAARSLGANVAVLADLPGPKLRAVLAGPVALVVGQEIVLAAHRQQAADVHVTESEPIRDAEVGDRVLMDDGRLQLRVKSADGNRLLAVVEVGGTLQPNKGINLPDTQLSIPALTRRDQESLASIASLGVDWLALSFVRGPEAASELRAAQQSLGLSMPIIAKIERPEAVERASQIVEAFDGIMVARGDLGVEIPLEQVPHVQKRFIKLARVAAKPVITATEMLDSMRTSPRPTRAEVADVANAIYDGTDAVMLSAETSVGEYPVEAVATMDRIAQETETHLPTDSAWDIPVANETIEDQITLAACSLARAVGAAAIVVPTDTGQTARLVARHRPRFTIVAPTPDETVVRRLALVWGQIPILLSNEIAGGDRLETAVRGAWKHGAAKSGDLVVIVAAHPIPDAHSSPTIRLVRVGFDGSSTAP